MRTLPRQGERPRFCCHQRHDTTAQLEGPTLSENQYRKKKSDFKEGHLYAKNQMHIHPAGDIDAAGGIGFVDVPEKAGQQLYSLGIATSVPISEA